MTNSNATNGTATTATTEVVRKHLIFLNCQSFNSKEKNKTYNTVSFLRRDGQSGQIMLFEQGAGKNKTHTIFVDELPDDIKALNFGDEVCVEFTVDDRMNIRFKSIHSVVKKTPFKF